MPEIDSFKAAHSSGDKKIPASNFSCSAVAVATAASALAVKVAFNSVKKLIFAACAAPSSVSFATNSSNSFTLDIIIAPNLICESSNLLNLPDKYSKITSLSGGKGALVLNIVCLILSINPFILGLTYT